MPQEYVAQTGSDPGLPHLLLYGIGNQVAAAPRCIQLQDVLINHQLSHGPVYTDMIDSSSSSTAWRSVLLSMATS